MGFFKTKKAKIITLIILLLLIFTYLIYQIASNMGDNQTESKPVADSTKQTARTVQETQTFQLNYVAGDHGTISGSISQTVEKGKDGTQITAVADSGYHFVEWSDNGSESPTRTDTNVQRDLYSKAIFSADIIYQTPTKTIKKSTAGPSQNSNNNTVIINYNITSVGPITGTPRPGFDLTAGTPNPSSATVSYQWQVSYDGENFEDIPDSTNMIYPVGLYDVGYLVRVMITGIGDYSGTAVSLPIEIVTIPLESIGPTTGTPQIDGELTAGELTPSDAWVDYQWQISDTLNGEYVDIPDSNSESYYINSADTYKFIRVKAVGYYVYSGEVTSEPVEILPTQAEGIANADQFNEYVINYRLSIGYFDPVEVTDFDNWVIGGADGAELGAITHIETLNPTRSLFIYVTNPIDINENTYTIHPTQSAMETGYIEPIPVVLGTPEILD